MAKGGEAEALHVINRCVAVGDIVGRRCAVATNLAVQDGSMGNIRAVDHDAACEHAVMPGFGWRAHL